MKGTSTDIEEDDGTSPAEAASGGGRVLIFIIAWRAERSLRAVLDRIPDELLEDASVDFLIIDDASGDRGVEIASEWAREKDVSGLVLLRNPANQGHGGSQKLGFRFAVDGGYDLVIVMQGCGTHDPAPLPAFIDTWRRTGAELVLGTGMPAHEREIGWRRRLVSRMLARLTGQHLQGFETGFRAFGTSFLKRVPFEVNANGSTFETEILLQALHAGAKIVELPAPGGNDPAGAGSAAGGFKSIAATLQWKLHQMGMVCSLKYRGPGHLRYSDKTFMAYSSHQLAMRELERRSPSKVLDIGCGPGYVAERVAATGAEVTGIDVHRPVRPGMRRFVPFDLESGPLPVDAWDYDVVLLLDVIEHLAEPEQFLLNLRNGCSLHALANADAAPAAPTLILSTPNVAFAAVRLNLLLGRFTYADRGILDITHKRLFTRRTLLRALEDCGYDVEAVHASGVPFAAVVGGRVGRMLGTITGWMARVWPTMFAFQFVVCCRPRPGVRQLLATAQRHKVGDERHMRVLQGKPHPIESR